jgi:SPP1 gp7 family putative phage head morphogenesis protein
MPDVQAFGVKFDQAIDFLKNKLPEASMRWDDLAPAVHAKVFTVAGATSVDLARDIQQSLVRALENGTTITQFRKDFDATVAKYGWSYNGKRGWRTAVIYNTNMRSAHMAGRWQQLQANKAARPFLQYRTAGDARVRKQHRRWNGLVYPIDDDFWKTHYPPNDFGCRCTVRPYGAAELESEGLKVAAPQAPASREVIGADGLLKDVLPDGIGRGWDNNVGMSWVAPEVALGRKLAALPQELQGQLVDKTITPAFQKVLGEQYKGFRNAVNELNKPRGDMQIIGFLDSAVLAAIRSSTSLVLESTAVVTLDNRTRHLSQEHKEDSVQYWPRDWFDKVPELLRNYRAVLYDTKPGAEALIVLPDEQYNDTIPKIVLKPNARSKHGPVLSVLSFGSASLAGLNERVQVNGVYQRRYQVLVGKIR